MPILLPFRPSVPAYKFRTTILGFEYGFQVRWNTRVARYVFDVLDSQSVMIAAGMPVLLGAYFGRSSGHLLFQSGVMLARDTTQLGQDAGFDDLGSRVQVLYFSRDDAAAELLGGLSPVT